MRKEKKVDSLVHVVLGTIIKVKCDSCDLHLIFEMVNNKIFDELSLAIFFSFLTILAVSNHEFLILGDLDSCEREVILLGLRMLKLTLNLF